MVFNLISNISQTFTCQIPAELYCKIGLRKTDHGSDVISLVLRVRVDAGDGRCWCFPSLGMCLADTARPCWCSAYSLVVHIVLQGGSSLHILHFFFLSGKYFEKELGQHSVITFCLLITFSLCVQSTFVLRIPQGTIMKIRSMQTCIMSSLPRCIFRCSVFRYVNLDNFFSNFVI